LTGRERIARAFERARSDRRLAFVPFLTAGDPDLEATRELAAVLGSCGADLLELGVPWSDPLADGPVLQRASERAIASGTTLASVLARVPEIRKVAGVPVVLFSYVNPLLRFGIARFAREAAACGVDGVLVTDLPPEEGAELSSAIGEYGLASVFLAAPTSTDRRLEAIVRASTGFVYAVSRTGVTGMRDELEPAARDLAVRLRALTELPVAVGFGVSKPEHVRALWAVADAFVVGSAIVDLVGRFGAGRRGREAIRSLCRDLAGAAASS
jgi:tryptophan synthase alpha chain